MPEDPSEMNPRQAALEAQLAALVPQRGSLDPAALLFSAGQVAERARTRRRRALLLWSQPLWAAACLGLVWMHVHTLDIPPQTLAPAVVAGADGHSAERATTRPTSYQTPDASPAQPVNDAPTSHLRYRDEALAQALSARLANPTAADAQDASGDALQEEGQPNQPSSPLQLRRQMLNALLRL